MKDFAASEEEAEKKHKIVIAQRDGTVTRGYFLSEISTGLDSLSNDPQSRFREAFASRYISGDGGPLDIDWSQVKAVFFVSTYEGDRGHEPVRFYGNGPQIECIWVEVVFHDGEVIEGCIRNSLRHLVDDGFFLHPSTPGGNNLLIYVNKAALQSYRVLGVRMEIPH